MTAEHHAAEPGHGQRPDGQIGPVGPVGQAGPESAPGRLPVARLLAILLPALALLGMALATLLISRATERERGQMLAAMQGRADSLIWALEGGARFFGGRHGQPRLADLVAEVARQPGVAWIALTDAEGRILADSNAALVGSVLYSPDELRLLAPDSVPRGRFSPDEPGIYETWKAFAPGRLHGRKHGEAPQEQRCIFVALDATGFAERLSSYALGLALMAGVVILACLALTALLVLAGRYRSSRRQLADAQALAAQVVREYPAGLVVLDNAGRALLCNARARAMLGMSAGRVSGHMPGHMAAARMSGRAASRERETPLHGSESAGQESASHESGGLESVGLDWAALMAELDTAEGTVLERELALWRPGHDPLPVQLTASRLRDGSGRPSGYLFALRDLGQIRRLERELRRHERLSALGNLAAGLAHEIRNPLSSIRGYATYLADRLDADLLGHAAALTLMEETERLNRVLSDLLGLARPRSLNRERASLARLLERAVRVAMPDADARQVRLSFTAPPGDALCDIDADRLMQAVLNLVINAIQATEAGGTVTLALGRDAGGWRISVRDTGAGMTAQVLGQVFTPYYTTRAGGTGLGLSISRQIVEQHGGTITASSVPGKGTTMTIVLPDDGTARTGGRKRP